MWIARIVCTGLLLFTLGCSSADDKWKADRPATVSAAGAITLDGKPLDAAQIVLVADGGGSHGASGLSDTEGKFVLSTFPPDAGAVPGNYKVMIVKSLVPEAQDMVHSENETYVPPTKATLLVPKKYTSVDSSGLTVQIPEAGTSDIKFELTSK